MNTLTPLTAEDLGLNFGEPDVQHVWRAVNNVPYGSALCGWDGPPTEQPKDFPVCEECWRRAKSEFPGYTS